jgi:hypothetical protein
MPCITEPNWEEARNQRSMIDTLTDMLCRVMGEIEYQEPGIVLDQDIKDWWAKHKKWDEERNKK